MTRRIFEDRADAGRQLAKALGRREAAQTVVLGLPRGGVPVAAEIALSLGAPLDLVMVRKIGVPGHEELAVGAVANGEAPHIMINADVARLVDLSDDRVRALTPPLLDEIKRRRKVYLGGRAPLPLEGKTAIVVDDGAATGATFKSALMAISDVGASHIVAALPVAPPSVVNELAKLADEVVCLIEPKDFGAVGQFYVDFAPLADADVIDSLERLQAAPENDA